MKAAELLDTAGGRIIYPAGGDESVGSGVKKQYPNTENAGKNRAKIDLLAHFEAKLAKIFFAGAPPPHPRPLAGAGWGGGGNPLNLELS